MTETKTPKAGEYWIHKNGLDIVYFIGLAPSGQMVWQCAGDNVEIGDLDWSGWHHEPRCDSFEWVEPPADVWPKWYMPSSTLSSTVFHRRDSKTTAVAVERDGREWKWEYDWTAQEDGIFVEITEAEALARLKPPEPEFCTACGVHSVVPGTTTCGGCAEYVSLEGTKVGTAKSTPVEHPGATIEMMQPMGPVAFFEKYHSVESPDDWVEITDQGHVLRKGIDHIIESDHGGNRWAVVHLSAGSCLGDIGISRCRCLRRHLPAPVPMLSVTRMPVRLWVHKDSRNDERYNVFVKITPPDESNLYREILCDNDGFFLEATE